MTTGARSAQVTVRSLVPGIKAGGFFNFILTLNPATSSEHLQQLTDYRGGDNVTFTISDLNVGESYNFVVVAANRFGESESKSSRTIVITGKAFNAKIIALYVDSLTTDPELGDSMTTDTETDALRSSGKRAKI